MGFRPVDDSDLAPKRERKRSETSESSKRSGIKRTDGTKRSTGSTGRAATPSPSRKPSSGGMKQATFDEDKTGKKKKNKKKKKTTAWTYVGIFLKVFGATAEVFALVLGVIIYCTMAGWLGDVGAIDL